MSKYSQYLFQPLNELSLTTVRNAANKSNNYLPMHIGTSKENRKSDQARYLNKKLYQHKDAGFASKMEAEANMDSINRWHSPSFSSSRLTYDPEEHRIRNFPNFHHY